MTVGAVAGTRRRMRRILYRPSFVPSSKLFEHPRPPIRVDWRSGGRFGINTDDLDEALAWMAEARRLGLTPSLPPPKRRVVRRGQMSSNPLWGCRVVLECGHTAVAKHPRVTHCACPHCLPKSERMVYKAKKKRGHRV